MAIVPATQSVLQAVQRIDREVPVTEIKTMDDLFQRAIEAAIGGAWATGGLRGRWSASRTE